VQVTPQVYGAPVYNNPNPPEQAGTTAYNPYGAYTGPGVTVTPSAFQNPYGPYTGGYVPVTPQNPDTLPQYGGGRTPSGGGSGGGSSGGTGGGNPPKPQQQQQQQQRPLSLQINNILNRSSSGRPGGNGAGSLYGYGHSYGASNQYTNPYGQGASSGTQSGTQYGAGTYSGQNLTPILLIGGVGLAAWALLGGKKHAHS
jgi:hypothetical protein